MMSLTLGQWIGLAIVIAGTVGQPDRWFSRADITVVADPLPSTGNVKTIKKTTNISQRLWAGSLDIASKALDTPFIQGLRNGTLPPTKFGAYVVQDAVYLEKQSEILMIASKNASSVDFKEILIGKAIKFMGYATDMYKDWQLADSSGVKLGSACQAYIDYKFDVAINKDPVYTIIAMIPCLKLWPWIGKELQNVTHDFGVYTKWVSGNFDPVYAGYETLDKMVDDWYARGLIEESTAMEVYRNCMTGEYLFFDRAMD